MGIHAGFDTALYPGDENMALLKAATNLKVVGFPLTVGWRAKRAELKEQGWGLAPLAQTSGPLEQPAVVGKLDGGVTADTMAASGFSTGSWVYLDLPALDPDYRTYLQTWAAEVRMRQFCPGVRCSHILADRVSQAVPGARIWTVRTGDVSKLAHSGTHYNGDMPLLDPHSGGFQYAYGFQHEQNVVIQAEGLFLNVDLDVRYYA